MTTQRLHDLLEELVTDATPVDGVDAAWERAARTRRRRRLAAVRVRRSRCSPWAGHA